MGELKIHEQLSFFQECTCERGIFCPSIEFDSDGMMKYHPCFHENHGKTFSESDMEYLCKYVGDGMNMMSMALMHPPKAIATKLSRIRKEGKFDYYKNLNRYW